MTPTEVNQLTRYLEELDSIQSALLTHTYAVDGENGEVALEILYPFWVGAVTRMQRLKNEMHARLMSVMLNETEPEVMDDPLEGMK
jgi:hypothetical protein